LGRLIRCKFYCHQQTATECGETDCCTDLAAHSRAVRPKHFCSGPCLWPLLWQEYIGQCVKTEVLAYFWRASCKLHGRRWCLL